jgi:cyclomaltodextrinase / maltogenic alpha-amylase / neopullulanase
MNKRLFIFLILIGIPSLPYAQTSDSLRPRNLSARHARPSEEWVRRGIIYEVNTRSFSPAGNFAGVEKRLPELKKLGVTILWIMPIHPVGVLNRKGTLGSQYSVQDYYAVNPEFGTIDDFQRLVNSAHKLGFHLIIDLVANHTAWDSKLIKEHPDWFTKDSSGKIVPPNPDWTDVADLNYSQPGLRRYMIEMMKYWIRDIGVDGFRCDVAELVPLDFWEDARAALDSIKPVMMLAEGAYPPHHLKAFDASYGWNTYWVLTPIIKGTKSVLAIDTVLGIEKAAYPEGSLRMRFSSNHDENAWDAPDVKKFGSKGAMLAAVIVNTLPGIPLLYNGQEVGSPKRLKLFEKIPIDWKDGSNFRKLYAALFELRKNEPAFSDGTMLRISTSNSRRVYAFARISGTNKFLVLINVGAKAFSGSMDVSSPELSTRIHITLTDVFTKKTTTTAVPASKLIPIKVPAMGFRILLLK